MSSMRVLVVDDDKEFSSLIGKTIELWGYGVVFASSGREALDVVSKKEADVVVLDYLMPDMDGIATLKEMRKIDEKIPVIMFTSFPDKRSIEGTEKLGIIAYVPKAGVFTNAESSLKAAIGIAEKRKF